MTTITLEDLAAKKAKPAEGLVISDHTFDLNKFTGSELVLTGKGTRGLVFKNQRQVQISFKDLVIDNASTGVTLKFDAISNQVLVSAVNAKLYGKSGNLASQMIYFVGTWSNVEIGGFEIDQRRNSNPGSTTTGACVQLQGVKSSSHNLGNVRIYQMVLRNTGDEGTYANHYGYDGGYAQGENLLVDDVKVFNSGRDFNQQWGFRNVTYRNCYGENGGLESDPNHCSALSMNGNTENLLIENCEFKNVAQLVYSGLPTNKIKALFTGVKYTQGTHSGTRNNQSAYLKGAGEYVFKNCVIDAPNVKIAAITADKCDVILIGESNKIVAPKVSREFEPATVTTFIPPPEITVSTQDLEVVTLTDYMGNVTTKYFTVIDGVRTEVKIS